MTEPQPIVFIIDDDISVREGISDLLRSVGLGAQTYASTQEFVSSMRPDARGCIILDVRLPGRSGLDFQQTLGETWNSTPCDLYQCPRRYSDLGAGYEIRSDRVLDQADQRAATA